MNRKHLFAIDDEADDADYEFLGSRLRNAVQWHSKAPLARVRRESPDHYKPRRRPRPEPYRDRSY
jgi:hypothetical protein